MIKTFKHKGLEKFYTSGNTKGVQAKHAKKLRMRLAALDTAHHLKTLISRAIGYTNSKAD
jgi:proteic killer suppression protein